MIVEDPSLKFELSGFKRGREVSLDMKSYLVSTSTSYEYIYFGI